MKTLQFITESPAAALEQIHRKLGPDAVVLSVRRLPAQGVTRLLHNPGRIEVMAGVPDKSSSATAETQSFPESSSNTFHYRNIGNLSWQFNYIGCRQLFILYLVYNRNDTVHHGYSANQSVIYGICHR